MRKTKRVTFVLSETPTPLSPVFINGLDVDTRYRLHTQRPHDYIRLASAEGRCHFMAAR